MHQMTGLNDLTKKGVESFLCLSVYCRAVPERQALVNCPETSAIAPYQTCPPHQTGLHRVDSLTWPPLPSPHYPYEYFWKNP